MTKKTFTLSLRLILFFSLINGFSLRAQTNNSAPYCQGQFSISPCNQPGLSNFPTNTINNFIDNVLTAGASSNIVNVNSGCNGLTNNYIHYCTPFLVGSLGQVITMSVQSGQLFPQSFGIFVDWNQNNNFELPAEQIDGTLNTVPTNSFFVTTFTVPPTQPIGLYRLRIRCYATTNAYPDPCANAIVGETEDYSFYVNNSGPPVLSAFLSYNPPLCSGQNLNLTINHNGSGATTFNWSGPGGFSSFVQNPTLSNIIPSVVGTYTVNINDGPCSIVKTIAINLTPTPTITVNSATVCAGNQATLVASGANTYTWNTGQTTPTVFITPVSTSTFMVSGETNSCIASNIATINVSPTFTMNITSSNSLVCTGTSITLNVFGATSYTWNTGANSNSIVLTPSATTTYSASGQTGPCSSQASFVQYVEDCSGLATNSVAESFFTVYPNPFANELTIVAPNNCRFRLVSSLGQLIIDKTVQNNEKIDTSVLQPGIYFVSLGNDSGNKAIKIIKN
ncbi:MAG: T9SS type A sorting domain-containing protein [Bacteroidia bacterium]|nr:T9SS type A sorting domain-containing protein [Bacteroidia bacterium]